MKASSSVASMLWEQEIHAELSHIAFSSFLASHSLLVFRPHGISFAGWDKATQSHRPRGLLGLSSHQTQPKEAAWKQTTSFAVGMH